MEVWRVVPPPAPTNLAVYNLGTFNRLVFTDNSVAETAYRWEFHLPGHPQFDWTEGDSFPGNAPGQTGTITFDDVAFAGLSPSYRVWANHFDGTTATNSGYSNVASAVPAGLRETIYDTIDFHDNPSNPNDPLVRIDPEINHNFDAEGAGSPAEINLKSDRVQYWIGKGAQPTDTVRRLMKQAAKTQAAAESQPEAA